MDTHTIKSEKELFSPEMTLSVIRELIELDTKEHKMLLIEMLSGLRILAEKAVTLDKVSKIASFMTVAPQGIASEEDIKQKMEQYIDVLADIYPDIVKSIQSDRIVRIMVKASYYSATDSFRALKLSLLMLNSCYLTKHLKRDIDLLKGNHDNSDEISSIEFFQKWSWAHMPERDQLQQQNHFKQGTLHQN